MVSYGKIIFGLVLSLLASQSIEALQFGNGGANTANTVPPNFANILKQLLEQATSGTNNGNMASGTGGMGGTGMGGTGSANLPNFSNSFLDFFRNFLTFMIALFNAFVRMFSGGSSLLKNDEPALIAKTEDPKLNEIDTECPHHKAIKELQPRVKNETQNRQQRSATIEESFNSENVEQLLHDFLSSLPVQQKKKK